MSIEAIKRELMIDIGGYDIYPDEVKRYKQPLSPVLDEEELDYSFERMMASIYHDPCQHEIERFLAKLPMRRRKLDYHSYLSQVIEHEHGIYVDDIDYQSLLDCIIQLSMLYKEQGYKPYEGCSNVTPVIIDWDYYDEGIRVKNGKLYVGEGGCMRVYDKNRLIEIKVIMKNNPDYDQYDRYRYKNGNYQVEIYNEDDELIFVDISHPRINGSIY